MNEEKLNNSFNIPRSIRTYAQAVAGKTKKMNFNPDTKHFEVQYEVCQICGETEIYLKEKLHYPSGYTVTFSPDNIASFHSPKENRIHIKHLEGSNGKLLNVTITLKN